MLPKKNRLPLRKRRQVTQKQAQSFSSTLFTVLVASPSDRKDKPTRFATLLSKKVSNQAVTRNKKRRQILNAAHQLLDSLPSGLDIIIISKKSITSANFQEIKDQLQTILKKYLTHDQSSD